MKMIKSVFAFVLSIVMVLLLFVVNDKTNYSDVDDYISSCTKYDSSLTVKTKTITSLMTYPCSSSVNSSSAVSTKVMKGTSLSVYELYKNTVGEYWYKVVYFGDTLFVKATDTDMVTHQIGDVTIVDPVSLLVRYGATVVLIPVYIDAVILPILL